MAKPDIALARWATGPLETLLVPSSGLRDTGFQAGDPIVEGYVNELFAQHFAWASYLDAGVLEGGIVIDGELEVGGVLTVDQDVVVTGDVFHGDQVMNIPGAMGRANANTTMEFGGYSASIESTGAATIVWPIPLRVGDVIKSVTLRVIGDGSADITAVDVVVIDSEAGSTSLFNVVPPANTTELSITDLVCNCTDHPVAEGDHILVGLVCNAAGIRVYGVDITFARPA